jgi:hypothetical protein
LIGNGKFDHLINILTLILKRNPQLLQILPYNVALVSC